MKIDELFAKIVEAGASDGFVTARAAPSIKVDGEIRALSKESLSEEQARELVLATMSPSQQEDFMRDQECNYAVYSEDHGRFRASAFVQRGQYGIVLRRIKDEIPKFGELGLPPIVAELAMAKRGLVIFVGGTGTGKSTSLAAMVGHRNRHSRGHILSIEDPIEFVHDHAGCLITQREVGIDTDSFETGLQNALRQAPDVILIGEVRSAETMAHAMSFAETGHLCLCTLHANNANQAIDRILSFFPVERHDQVLMDLSLNLNAMIAQQLLPKATGEGRVPVMEVLLNSPLISDHIRNGQVHLVKEVMAKSTEQGMQTLDQSLLAKYCDGEITAEEAIRCADSANEVRLGIKMFDKRKSNYSAGVSLQVDR
ncbi:PilT/PilU family type 4a pilus ATPase [Congregibacter variabilis]|uniref:PilT/PilU family type 4a pilus ATPase n=1 Tax=Congregibacter variabilis TaxID=3081200 RepID=A0ABZ0HZQ8_9GAMM|nr:PilT/PilU family type 4a pilus ATPase [Congregibacter sp. IMCC43200]